MGCSFRLKTSTLKYFKLSFESGYHAGFLNISVRSSLGVVVSNSLKNMAASGVSDVRRKEDE